MDNKKLIRNSKLMIAMSLVIVFVLMATYAWMSISRTSTVVNKISAGSLDLVFDETCEAGEECDGIHLEKAVPMSFRQGLTTKAYKFKLINNSASATDYTINMEDFYEGVTVPTEGKIVDSKIRYIILEDEETAEASNSKLLSDGRSIKTGTLEGNKTINYTLYVWIDSRAGIEVNNQIFSGRLSISAEQQTPTYEVSGVLTDDNDQISPNTTLAAFKKSGEIETVVTDTEGKFKLTSLPSGNIKVYYIPTGVDPTGKTDTELSETSGVATATITAPSSTDTAVLTNAYKINVLNVKLATKAPSGGYNNKNILAAYKYVEPTNIVKEGKTVTSYDGCITGEEEQCEQVFIGKNTAVEPGTIIKYKVNNSEEKYFFVIHDDGNKLTMQHRENTTPQVAWYASEAEDDDYTHGPLTALAALETATSGWTNVNDITYTMGTTEFGSGTFKNAYTGCKTQYNDSLNCDTMAYQLEERTAKARMITGQEANSLGCRWQSQVEEERCPVWMINYLHDSSSYGGTVNVENPANKYLYGYWTMSANIREDVEEFNQAIEIIQTARMVAGSNMDDDYWHATRAVVEINK